MTQNKTYVEHLPGKLRRAKASEVQSASRLEPPGDLNEYLASRQSNAQTPTETMPVCAPPPALDESDQGGSSMITT